MAGKFQTISISGIDKDKTRILNGLYAYQFTLSSIPDAEWQRAFADHWKAKDYPNSVGGASFVGNTAAVRIDSKLGDASKVKTYAQEAADAANNKFIEFEKSLDDVNFAKA